MGWIHTVAFWSLNTLFCVKNTWLLYKYILYVLNTLPVYRQDACVCLCGMCLPRTLCFSRSTYKKRSKWRFFFFCSCASRSEKGLPEKQEDEQLHSAQRGHGRAAGQRSQKSYCGQVWRHLRSVCERVRRFPHGVVNFNVRLVNSSKRWFSEITIDTWCNCSLL